MSMEVAFKHTLVHHLGQTGHLINLSHLPADAIVIKEAFYNIYLADRDINFYHPIIRPPENQQGKRQPYTVGNTS